MDVEIAEVGGEQAVRPLWEPERQEPHLSTCLHLIQSQCSPLDSVSPRPYVELSGDPAL